MVSLVDTDPDYKILTVAVLGQHQDSHKCFAVFQSVIAKHDMSRELLNEHKNFCNL